MSIMPFAHEKLWCPLKRGCSVPAQKANYKETVFQINYFLVPSLLSSGLKQGTNERFKAKKANHTGIYNIAKSSNTLTVVASWHCCIEFRIHIFSFGAFEGASEWA